MATKDELKALIAQVRLPVVPGAMLDKLNDFIDGMPDAEVDRSYTFWTALLPPS